MQVNFTIHPRRIGFILGFIALYLAGQSLLTEYLVEEVVHPDADSILIPVLDLFSVNLEESIPTWYSVINLFVAASILFAITISQFRTEDRWRWYWAGLAVIFLYLSMDEGAVIHEIIASPLQEQFNTSGYLEFGWQIVAVPLVIIFGLFYFRFWLNLPPHTRLWFAIAAVMYTGSGLIIEGISANEFSQDGLNMTYLTIATIEEAGEMLGVIVFIYALLVYIVQSNIPFVFQLSPAETVARKSVYIWRVVLVLSVIIIALNISLIYGANQLKTPTTVVIERTTPTHHLIADEYREQGATVTQFTGVFNQENQPARQLAAAFLTVYSDVIIISLVEQNLSLIIGGDSLPVSPGELTARLNENGETQFIIYDTPVVRIFTQNIPGENR